MKYGNGYQLVPVPPPTVSHEVWRDGMRIGWLDWVPGSGHFPRCCENGCTHLPGPLTRMDALDRLWRKHTEVTA